MKTKKYTVMFVVLFLFLVLHLLFYPFQLIKDAPLSGYFQKPSAPEFSAEAYFSKALQDSTENYLKYNFGLFPGLTRIHNQLEYSLFDKLNVHDVYKGKEGYLHRYTKDYFEKKTYGSYTLSHYLDLLKRFSDTLALKGKKVIWVITPDKSIVYKETLPEGIDISQPINGYYEEFKAGLKAGKFNYIDFNELAIAEKNVFPFPVCTKGGVHWTQAYAARCFDSLCKYMAAVSDIKIKNKLEYYETGTVWGPDYDIENAANLLVPLERQDSCYLAKVTTESSASTKKLLLVGDSFCHAWMWNKFFKSGISASSEFWYYNRDATLFDNAPIKRNPDNLPINQYIEKFDIVVITFSAGNLYMLDYGFLEDVFKNAKQ